MLLVVIASCVTSIVSLVTFKCFNFSCLTAFCPLPRGPRVSSACFVRSSAAGFRRSSRGQPKDPGWLCLLRLSVGRDALAVQPSPPTSWCWACLVRPVYDQYLEGRCSARSRPFCTSCQTSRDSYHRKSFYPSMRLKRLPFALKSPMFQQKK